ncbi:hypothetical protein OPV22_006864 [Ensete ventricosum]|uniref:Uncharacterized protein n=1 Tax=Ensete ventricosum TaxID=4639 RepID=A0AAV8RTM5_ENSVE|nr:hypothetical protein OPV22_006864 [Ensete ventricosum]
MGHARLVPSAIQFSAYQLRRGATAKDAIAFQLWYGDELADGKREEWGRVGSGRGRPQRDPPFLGHAKERQSIFDHVVLEVDYQMKESWVRHKGIISICRQTFQ